MLSTVYGLRPSLYRYGIYMVICRLHNGTYQIVSNGVNMKNYKMRHSE